VVNLVNFQQNGIHDVVSNQLKIWFVQQVCDILSRSGEEVVQANNLQRQAESEYEGAEHETCTAQAVLQYAGKNIA
jgi:hypothetical protein